ncbi:MAG: DUF2127 domain-containing protein [Acidobacteriaceae bacterium]|nr:DUF2127 domain-containing protein [Acidobacteriaceae bacterium]
MSAPVTPPHPAPSAIDERASTAGLRAVAGFEALKGAVVLLLGLTLFILHRHAEDYAERLLYHLHMDPDRHFARAILNAALKLSDARLWTIAAATLTYCTVRFVEAWGLWNRRVWAEWFALLSGAMYLPWEILKVSERADWERIGVLAVNIVIVLYMLEVRIRGCSTLTGCEEPGETQTRP